LLLDAVFTDPIDPHFHFIDTAGESLPQWLDFDAETVRVQAIHLATAFTVKMRMWLMVRIGRQTVVKSPAAGADAFDDTTVDEQIEIAIDCHPVNRTAAFKRLKYVSG
jgi:hypothetical protein